VIGLARSELDLDGLASLPDDEVAAALTALSGLGQWTADWFLARHLARPTAWPAGDLGVRMAVSSFYADGRALTIKPMSIKEVRAMGERFAPFQNLSAQFLLMGARLAG
jgi:DNA-3-methyladenine glycosylase II